MKLRWVLNLDTSLINPSNWNIYFGYYLPQETCAKHFKCTKEHASYILVFLLVELMYMYIYVYIFELNVPITKISYLLCLLLWIWISKLIRNFCAMKLLVFCHDCPYLSTRSSFSNLPSMACLLVTAYCHVPITKFSATHIVRVMGDLWAYKGLNAPHQAGLLGCGLLFSVPWIIKIKRISHEA